MLSINREEVTEFCRVCTLESASCFTGRNNTDGKTFGGQHIADHVGPLYNDRRLPIIDHLFELGTHDAGFVQAIKIKMVYGQRAGPVLIHQSKARAADGVLTAGARGQSAHESRLAAAKVTQQLNHFATAQLTPDGGGEPQRFV